MGRRIIAQTKPECKEFRGEGVERGQWDGFIIVPFAEPVKNRQGMPRKCSAIY